MKIQKIFTRKRLSLIYVVLFALLLIGAIFFGSSGRGGIINEGDVSLKNIYAPFDFEFPWEVDEIRTEALKREARTSVPLTFKVDNTREESAIRNITFLFDNLDLIRNAKDKSQRQAAIDEIRDKSGIDIPENLIIYFADRGDTDIILNGVIDIISSVYPLGIINYGEVYGIDRDAKSIRIVNAETKTERIYSIDNILTVQKAMSVCKVNVGHVFQQDARLKSYVLELINKTLSPNAIYQKEKTEREVANALTDVKPVYNKIEVKKNELIVERGQRVSARNIKQLESLGMLGGISNKGVYILGILTLIILLSFISFVFLSTVERKLLSSPKEVAILLFNCLIIIIAGQFIIQSPYSSYVIPLAGASVLLVFLINTNAAVLATVALSVFIGMLAGGRFDVSLVLLVGGFTGIYVVSDSRRRSKIIVAGLASGAMMAIATISIGFINNYDLETMAHNAVWAGLGGFISIFLAMGLLPFFEYIFKVTTDITLLELSDLNHSILKQLKVKAPGTYQHSIMVGNMAEAACDAIGANSLLARVGSYYHDIGKVEKAEYFSENEMGAVSKHEKLTPSMSALIIVNHVKDGVELAKKHKLGSRIIDFIEQHHGTGLIYFFYQRALEKSREDETLREEEFRYPGPKPQTKEAAIVLLADSVEASSRTLQDPTPSRIRSLVQKIINNKFIDNQLDECDLTLKDLNKIADSFSRLLIAVFHTRIEYPLGVKKINGKI